MVLKASFVLSLMYLLGCSREHIGKVSVKTLITSKPYPLNYFGMPDNFVVDTVFAGDTVVFLQEFYSKDFFVYKVRSRKGKTGFSTFPDNFEKLKR